MDEKISDPLVPAEVDLRDFQFMPLDVLRLRDSDLAALATGEEFKAAVLLWCAAWHQIPAGSVPKDDRWLAKHSGAGSSWKKVRDLAMRGFVECSDGRLYHVVVAEKAIEAWTKKQEQRAKTLKARIAITEKRIKEAKTDSERTHAQTLLQTLSQELSQQLSQMQSQPMSQRPRDSKGTGTVKGQGQGQGIDISPRPPSGGEDPPKKPPSPKREMPSIPPSLDSPEFRESWEKFINHRKEKRNSLTPTAAKTQLKRLEKMGMKRAIDAIEFSVASGWTGIFEANETSSGGSKNERNADGTRPGERPEQAGSLRRLADKSRDEGGASADHDERRAG